MHYSIYNLVMKNIIDLPPEYWFALGYLADEMGYKSRQELIGFVLKCTVDQHPEMLARGVEKRDLLVTAKKKVQDLERVRRLAPVVIPRMGRKPGVQDWVVRMKNGEEHRVKALTLLEAGQVILNKSDLTIEEFREEYETYRIE